MKKQVYEIDENNFFKKIHLASFDGNGNCLEELAENIITVDIPQGLYRAKWTGVEWIEDMTQEEIDELKKQSEEPSLEDLQTEYNVDIDYRLSLIEMGLI